MNKLVILITLLLFALQSQAQDGALEEYFFESGKIKVVIAVAVSIAIGMFAYLFRLDKKIKDLENNSK